MNSEQMRLSKAATHREPHRGGHLMMPLRILALCAVAFALAPPLAYCARPPNIVFFLADDLGWSDTTLYVKTSFYETPNIERLAKQGVRFTQAYAACHVCSPTRASILTGK